MPTIKDILRGPIAIPKSVEANLPAGAPKLSQIMENIITGLPAGPALPGNSQSLALTPKEFIKSLEEVMPSELPKVSEILPKKTEYRPIETEVRAAVTTKGGYRGIS